MQNRYIILSNLLRPRIFTESAGRQPRAGRMLSQLHDGGRVQST